MPYVAGWSCRATSRSFALVRRRVSGRRPWQSEPRHNRHVPEPSFTLVQLRYFVAAAERGSMTAAAKDLVVSQSAISTAIAQLEHDLGVQLLLRHHARGLTTTQAGVAFLREAREFLGHATELANVARGAGGELVGSLHLGCFATLAPFLLPRMVSAFADAHPEVHLRVGEGEHAALKSALRSGENELSLMYGYDLEEDLDRVVIRRLRPYAIVAPGHRSQGARTCGCANSSSTTR